jgi:hypothetical protein
MMRVIIRSLLLIAAGASSALVLAQPPSDAPKTAAPAAPAAESPAPAAAAAPPSEMETQPFRIIVNPTTAPAQDAKNSPSADTLKKAKEAGLKPETKSDGSTQFCWEDTNTGTRFKTKKCVSEAQLPNLLAARQAQRDDIKAGAKCSGNCGGK